MPPPPCANPFGAARLVRARYHLRVPNSDDQAKPTRRPDRLVRGRDFYVENGNFVFTAEYHLKRGYCCNSDCRHCPYKEGAMPTVDVSIIGIDHASKP